MSIRYRPEIDGLRAIAVLAVVFYHAELAFGGVVPFEGGFVGVDVFFVISGYLITSIILADLERTDFSYRRFYERRARRILPAVLLVMLVSIPFAWRLMLPQALMEYAGSVLSSIFFVSNFWFWAEDSYFAEPAALKPFLHTWSLSVEEQFYLLFPVFLVLIWQRARRHILVIFALGFLLSLLLAEFWVDVDADGAFYMLPARGWELLAGGLLARLEMSRGRVAHPWLELAMPVLGLYLVLHSVFLFDAHTRHPSFATLMPVVGTMLIVWFAKPGSLVSRVLGSRPMVAVGLISYSLYLWHFPIFAFGRIGNPEPEHLVLFGWILLALALSVASYYLVEKPFRSRTVSVHRVVTALSISVVALITVNAHVLTTGGAPQRYGGLANLFEESEYLGCSNTPARPGVPFPCAVVDEGANGEIVLIGDSHARELANRLRFHAEERGYRFLQNTVNGCLLIEGLIRQVSAGDYCYRNSDLPGFFNDWLADNPVPSGKRILVWAGRLPVQLHGSFDNGEGGVERFKPGEIAPLEPIDPQDDRSIEEIAIDQFERWARGSDLLVLIYPIPEVGWNARRMIVKAWEENKDLQRYEDLLDGIPVSTSLPVYLQRTARSFEILDQIEGENILRIYPHETFCSDETGRCYYLGERGIYYRDDDHVSRLGAEMIIDTFEEVFGP